MKMQQTAILAAVLTMCSGVAFAQTAERTANDKTPRPAAPEWTQSDTNRDGYLTKEELIPFPTVLKKFEEIDTDGDGRISEQEYSVWREGS